MGVKLLKDTQRKQRDSSRHKERNKLMANKRLDNSLNVISTMMSCQWTPHQTASSKVSTCSTKGQ